MPATTSSALSVEIKSIPATRVVSLRAIIPNYNSQTPLWSPVHGFVATHSIPVTGACFAIFYDPGYKESDVDNEVCMPIADDAVAPEESKDIRVYVVPELPRVASVVHTGPYSGLTEVYNQLFAWLGANGESCNGPNREIYHVGLDTYEGDETKLVTEVIVPLA